MKSVVLCALFLAVALAAPDKNLKGSPLIVRVGPRGRQVVAGGQRALKKGAVFRRRGRGNRLALNPAVAVPALNLRAVAPAVHHHHVAAPAVVRATPLQVLQQPAFPPLTPFAPLPLAPRPVAAPAIQRIVPAPIPQLAVAVPAPAPVVRVQQPTLEFGAPSTVAPEVRAPVDSYLAEAPRDSYLAAEPAVEEVVEARDNYGSPAEEVVEARDNYGSPAEVVEARDNYGSPAEEVEARSDYASPPAAATAAVPTVVAVRTNVKSDLVRSEPIAIVRSVYNPPAATPVFDYSFETANGITQEAVGTMRLVDDTEVSVMKGSYSYLGADGELYQVDWYADETGFHPSAPHLPQSVEPDHPEVAAAVRAQIAFAAEEDAAAAASGRAPLAYAAPEAPLQQYGR